MVRQINLSITPQERAEVEPVQDRLRAFLDVLPFSGLERSFDQDLTAEGFEPESAQQVTDTLFQGSPRLQAERFMTAGLKLPPQVFQYLRKLRQAQPPARFGSASQAAVQQSATEFGQVYKRALEEWRTGVVVPKDRQRAEGLLRAETEKEDLLRQFLPGDTALTGEKAYAVLKVAEWSAKRIQELTDKVEQELFQGIEDPPSLNLLLAQIKHHGEFVDPRRLGPEAETGRGLAMFNDPEQGTVQYLDQFTKLFKDINSDWTPEVLIARLKMLKTPEQIDAFARKASRATTTDMLLEYWINALLSGPATHAANIIDNAFRVWIASPMERTFGALMPWSEISLSEVGQGLKAMYRAKLEAWRMASEAFNAARRGDEAYASRGSKIELRRRAITAENWGLDPENSSLGWAVDRMGNLIRTPGNLLMAEDEFFKTFAYRFELAALAEREARKRATAEGLQGAKWRERVKTLRERMIQNPPESLHHSAQKYATYMTLQKELGAAGTYIEKAINANPGLKIVMPFFRTPVNYAKHTWERTPLLGIISKQFWSDVLSGDPARRDMALAKQAMGAMVVGTAVMLAASGLITGSGPADPDLQQRVDFPRKSFKIGDKWYSYERLGVFGQVLGISADYFHRSWGTETNDATQEYWAAALVLAVSKNVTNPTFVKGMAEVFRALAFPDDYAERQIDELMSSVIPNLATQINRTVLDPTLREAESILDGSIDPMLTRLPIASYLLEPKLDLWARRRNLDREWYDLVNPVTRKDDLREQHPVIQEIWKHRIVVEMPPRTHPGTGIELTPKEYNRLLRMMNDGTLMGRPMLEYLDDFVRSEAYTSLTGVGPKSLKAELIRDIIRAHKEEAWNRLIESNEFPDLTRSVRAEEERLLRQKQ